jgi:hypothetical protein
MRKKWRSLLSLLSLYHLSHFTFELAGKAFTTPQLNTVADLWEEFDDQLPSDFYRAFGKAIEWQKNKEADRARVMYNTLLNSVREHEPSLYDQVHPFIVHNMRSLP